MEFKPFRLHYTAPDQHAAPRYAEQIEAAYEELSSNLGLQLAGTTDLFLCPTEELFNELTGNLVPHWGEGVADPIHNLIVLKSPELTGNRQRFPRLVRHELIHILVGRAVRSPQSVPKWFSEGVAMFFSRDEEFASGKAISKALLSDSVIPLDEIDDVLRFHSAKARLAYEESYSFTAFIEEQLGKGSLLRLIRELRQRPNFSEAFAQALGVHLFDLEFEWMQYVAKKYRWRFFLDFETFLWIFVLFLFILVVIRIRFRNRAVMKRWDEEEGLAE